MDAPINLNAAFRILTNRARQDLPGCLGFLLGMLLANPLLVLQGAYFLSSPSWHGITLVVLGLAFGHLLINAGLMTRMLYLWHCLRSSLQQLSIDSRFRSIKSAELFQGSEEQIADIEKWLIGFNGVYSGTVDQFVRFLYAPGTCLFAHYGIGRPFQSYVLISALPKPTTPATNFRLFHELAHAVVIGQPTHLLSRISILGGLLAWIVCFWDAELGGMEFFTMLTVAMLYIWDTARRAQSKVLLTEIQADTIAAGYIGADARAKLARSLPPGPDHNMSAMDNRSREGWYQHIMKSRKDPSDFLSATAHTPLQPVDLAYLALIFFIGWRGDGAGYGDVMTAFFLVAGALLLFLVVFILQVAARLAVDEEVNARFPYSRGASDESGNRHHKK